MSKKETFCAERTDREPSLILLERSVRAQTDALRLLRLIVSLFDRLFVPVIPPGQLTPEVRVSLSVVEHPPLSFITQQQPRFLPV